MHTRYNHRIQHMQSRPAGGLQFLWFGAILFLAISTSSASVLGDSARQLAHKIAALTGPGTVALDVANRSSLDERSVREVRGNLEAQLRTEGVRTAQPEQAIGTVAVTLSENMREYVWSAIVSMGSDEKRIAMVALPRPSGLASSAATTVVLRKSLLFAQENPVLDVAFIDMAGGGRLFVLDGRQVAMYSQQNGRWESEGEWPITHSRIFPRDLRGRLLLRRDHLFDVYLPGVYCRSGASVPISLNCNDSDDPWPLSADEGSVRAFYAPARNFFTGALSPGMGKLLNVPSFYSSAALPRAGYTLWILTAVDGSVHLIDGMTDQAVRVTSWGSEIAAVHSSCGSGNQILVSESGDLARDRIRAFELPDRDPVAASSAIDFDGSVVALWPEAAGGTAIAVVKRQDTGWYEAYRISVFCGL